MIANLFILLCLFERGLLSQHDFKNAEQFPRRLLELIKMYNERGARHLEQVQAIRATHEVSQHFEMGYLMCEILERYRKMVGIAKRPTVWTMDNVFQTVKYLELIQKLFLEIYHLVNMFHEVSLKYRLRPGEEQEPGNLAVNKEGYNNADKMIKRIEDLKRIRYLEKKKKIRQIKKQRQVFMKYGQPSSAHKNRRPPNKYWPIDYGWEVNYQWWD